MTCTVIDDASGEVLETGLNVADAAVLMMTLIKAEEFISGFEDDEMQIAEGSL